jgi:hypothetical protein
MGSLDKKYKPVNNFILRVILKEIWVCVVRGHVSKQTLHNKHIKMFNNCYQLTSIVTDRFK